MEPPSPYSEPIHQAAGGGPTDRWMIVAVCSEAEGARSIGQDDPSLELWS